MGATVTTGKSVSAFKGTDGRPFYVLWEQTYEKNCYPHTPRWSCIGMGYLESVMKRIFRAGSSCEGGMLQRRGGYLKPEGYIASWLQELANPALLPDLPFNLKVGKGFYDPIQTDELEKALQLLANAGYHAVADALESEGSVNLSLHSDIDLIDVLYQGEVVYPWRIIDTSSMHLHGERCTELGYKPTKVKASPFSVPTFMQIDANNEGLLIQNDDGSWYTAGWEHSVIGDYVREIWQDELREPGTMRARLKVMREAIKHASVLDKSKAMVLTDTNIQMGAYERLKVNESAEKLPSEIKDGVIRWNVPEEIEQRYLLTRLPTHCTKWVVSEKPALSTTYEQLSLLVA